MLLNIFITLAAAFSLSNCHKTSFPTDNSDTVSFKQIEQKKIADYTVSLLPNEDEATIGKFVLRILKNGKDSIVPIEEGAVRLSLVRGWSGIDIDNDGYAEIVLSYDTGGNCALCVGLSIYTVFNGKIEKVELGAPQTRVEKIARENATGEPLIYISRTFYADFLPSAFQAELPDILKPTHYKGVFIPAMASTERKALVGDFLAQTQLSLATPKNSVELYQAAANAMLGTKYYPDFATEKSSLPRLREALLAEIRQKCLRLHFDDCKEYDRKIRDFIDSNDNI